MAKKVFWEAHRAQFELLADRNGWVDKKCVIQLATILKGGALEVLSQLDGVARGIYDMLVQALQ